MSEIEVTEMQEVRLTQYSHGAGCGCKIAPNVLEEILRGSFVQPDYKNLLVGNHSKDDAAVYDLQNGTALISTTDFFMPIVDDAYDFGQIAAANAISDVYAMGGNPLIAIAILGWPVKKLPTSIAARVIEGARNICAQAGIPLAGGHSIDTAEPIFGLAVNGLVNTSEIKQNNTAKAGDYIFLTKKLGVGILTTAEKRCKLLPGDTKLARDQMVQLNRFGRLAGGLQGVNAMTDVTGFGLGGHLTEVAEGSNLTAELYWNKIPRITDLSFYVENNVYPDGTNRNWNSYGFKVSGHRSISEKELFMLLADPQTNGGLLISVAENEVGNIQQLLRNNELSGFVEPIGRMVERRQNVIEVKC